MQEFPKKFTEDGFAFKLLGQTRDHAIYRRQRAMRIMYEITHKDDPCKALYVSKSLGNAMHTSSWTS